jgi:aspartate racemase
LTRAYRADRRIGPAATEHYYRGLVERHAASGIPLELTIAHADVRELSRNLASHDAVKQAGLFLRLVRRLEAAGAGAAAVTSMGGHFCIKELEAVSPLPILNAIPEVDAAIRQGGLKTIGILGTRLVMESGLYGGITAARIAAARRGARRGPQQLCRHGDRGPRDRCAAPRLFAIGQQLCGSRAPRRSCSAAPICFWRSRARIADPVIDCAEVHVAAIYRKSAGEA